MKKFKIATISKQEFINRIKKRGLENYDSVKTVEDYFKKKRGYIFKMPRPGSSVILMVSGGIESTITWALLLEKYRLNVYPLFLHRGMYRKKKELAAVKFFTKYFQKKYPKLFHPPQEFSTHLPPPELESMAMNYFSYYHPMRILENYDSNENLSQIMVQHGILPFAFPLYGVAYGNHLWDHNNIKVTTVFCGVAPGDGDFVASQTFSALRATLFSTCIATDNFSWQIASLAFESEIGHWLEKHDLIALANKMGLPLDRTWSCYHSRKYQCGDQCLTCQYRRIAFKKAGVTDRTHYESTDFFINNLRKIKRNLRLSFDRIFSIM